MKNVYKVIISKFFPDPFKLEEESKLDLAIKFSTWPPAHWIHTEAKLGAPVSIRIGEANLLYFLMFLISKGYAVSTQE